MLVFGWLYLIGTNQTHAASFLLNHYVKAHKVIEEISMELPQIQANLGIADGDFEEYIKQECIYLHGLKSEPPEETLRYQYVEALQDQEKQRYDNTDSI
jgi:hypothetical protein